MKKTISINIGGVIFHIEEDGYDKLRSYLTSVQQYFSTYEDSQEIVTDIENRIAEKLLHKLKTADKQGIPRQAVSLDDVNELVAAMGTVADFEAVEEEEVLVAGGGRYSAPNTSRPNNPTGSATATGSAGPQPTGTTATFDGPRRLVRDLRRKTLGGVCAGLAYYFNIDVVWVRLLFVALFLGFPALSGATGGPDEFFGGLSGFTFLVYVAMWIALPGVMTIEEDKTVKKFFRNPEDKVLGGVASGIAAYFGVDTGVIRLLFVLGIVFFGFGFLLYLVLWVISPQANTLTEKMEMQGRPITLSNIESSIKQNLNINEAPNQESTLTRILLFPFRAIATIISGLGGAFGPLLKGIVAVIRVFAGIVCLVIAFALMIAGLAVLAAVLGIESGAHFGNLPIEYIRADITAPMILSGLVFWLIMAFWLAIAGVALITMRSTISGRTALTIAGVQLISLVVFLGTVSPLASSFQRRSTVEETKVINVAAAVPTFALNDVEGEYDNWEVRPSLELIGYEGNSLNLVQHLRAQGRTRAEAQDNARQIRYVFAVQDSTVRFDNALELQPNSRFRGQDMDMELMIPYEKPFRMTKDFARFIRNVFGGREIDRMEASLWKFTRANGLVCINFPREKDRDDNSDDFDVSDINDEVQNAIAGELGDDFDNIGSNTRQFPVSNFAKVDIGGAFVVRFRKGDTYKVVADGREKDLEELDVTVDGNTLNVSLKNKGLFNWNDRKRIGLTITVPTIEEVKLSGASKANLAEFGHFSKLSIDMNGACRTVFNGSVDKLELSLSGASNATLRGDARQFDAELTGASKLDATGLHIDKASVDARGASHADLGQVGSLDSEASGASKITRQ